MNDPMFSTLIYPQNILNSLIIEELVSMNSPSSDRQFPVEEELKQQPKYPSLCNHLKENVTNYYMELI